MRRAGTFLIVAGLLLMARLANAQKISFENFLDRFATAQRGQLTKMYFGDKDADACPQFTAVLDSVENRVRLLVPTSDVSSHVEAAPPNATVFAIERPRCRYTLSVKWLNRGTSHRDTEAGVLSRLIDRWEPMVHLGLPPSEQRRLVEDGGLNDRGQEPDDDSRYAALRLESHFDANEQLTFSTLVSFGPTNVALFLGEEADGLRLSLQKSRALRAYDVSIGNGASRVEVVIAREIRVDGQWMRSLD